MSQSANRQKTIHSLANDNDVTKSRVIEPWLPSRTTAVLLLPLGIFEAYIIFEANIEIEKR